METLIPSYPQVRSRSWERAGAKPYAVINPATEAVVGMVPLCSPSDVSLAVEQAQTAFATWRWVPALERSKLLHRMAALFEQRLENMAELLTLEQGKPLSDSRKELHTTLRCIRLYAEEALRIEGDARPGEAGNTLSLVLKQPLGVVAAIGPSNYPVELLLWKIAPALAVGCVVVAKAPLETPLAVSAMMGCFLEAGFPQGTVNLLLGGADVGAALVAHPGVQKVAFTGSTEVGRLIAQAAGAGLKSVTLELGGSAPFIVCEDADLEKAMTGALRRSYSNAGQICIAVKRLLVQHSRYTEFVQVFVERAKRIKIANGLEPSAEMGPLVSAAYLERVHTQVEALQATGAKLLLGGQPLGGLGYFYPPTVLALSAEQMRSFDQEIFGPVVCVTPFQSDAEALELANGSSYGLAAYCYTQNLSRALWFATRLEAGGVGVNVNDVSELSKPFGGWKASGIGRELGAYALENYVALKHVRLGM